MTDSNRSLNFQAWNVEVIPPASFQSEVWQRIAARAPTRRGLLGGWSERLILLLPRPAFAAALVMACTGLGLGLGYTAAGYARTAALQEGRALYMASINPLVHTASSLE